MKRIWKILLTTFLILLAIYGLLAFYYAGRFPAGTYANGIYIGGYSLEDAAWALNASSTGFTFTLIDRDYEFHRIQSSELSYKTDYSKDLKSRLGANALLWPYYLVRGSSFEVKCEESFDEEALESWLLTVYEAEFSKEYDLNLSYEDEHFSLYDGKKDRLNRERLISECIRRIREHGFLLAVSGEDFYEDLAYSDDDRELLTRFERCKAYEEHELLIFFGADVETLGLDTFYDWMYKDRNGIPVFDEEGHAVFDDACIRDYCSMLDEKYSTLTSSRSFKTHAGKEILLKPGTYGNEIDEEDLYDFVSSYLSDLSVGDYEAVYETVRIAGLNDIGSDYIEIDLGHQHLYLYRDGEQVIDTDIVSGNMYLDRDTPEGVYYVYYKKKDVILRGRDYESHVDYWMAVYKGYGIHDASWRRKFGGEYYINSGSHGCINVPTDIMPDIYEKSYLGIPVILYY